MGFISRVEPAGPELIKALTDYHALLQQVGCLKFLLSFHGYNSQVDRAFASGFDGKTAKIGDIELHVDENIISKATSLPLKGERWFKTMRVKEIPWSEFLSSPKVKYDSKGSKHVTRSMRRNLGMEINPMCQTGANMDLFQSSVQTTTASPTSKPHKIGKSSVVDACNNPNELIDFENKKKGRKITRMLRNKSKGTSNIDSPIVVEDEGLESTQETTTQNAPSSPTMEKPTEENSKIDPSLEASFWKAKYHNIMPILQSNMIDLELEKEKLKTLNKSLIADNEKKLNEIKCRADKKEKCCGY